MLSSGRSSPRSNARLSRCLLSPRPGMHRRVLTRSPARAITFRLCRGDRRRPRWPSARRSRRPRPAARRPPPQPTAGHQYPHGLRLPAPARPISATSRVRRHEACRRTTGRSVAEGLEGFTPGSLRLLEPSSIFATFSPQRLFTALGSAVTGRLRFHRRTGRDQNGGMSTSGPSACRI